MDLANSGRHQGECGATGLAGAAGSCVAALQAPALVLAQTTPNTGVLVFLDCILKTLSGNITLAADGFGLLDLLKSWSGVSNREEELWIFIETTGLI